MQLSINGECFFKCRTFGHHLYMRPVCEQRTHIIKLFGLRNCLHTMPVATFRGLMPGSLPRLSPFTSSSTCICTHTQPLGPAQFPMCTNQDDRKPTWLADWLSVHTRSLRDHHLPLIPCFNTCVNFSIRGLATVSWIF